jgi:hypothetical protein
VEENAWYIGMLLYKEADYRRKKNSICKEAVAKDNPIIPGSWVVVEENAWYIGMLYTRKLIIEGKRIVSARKQSRKTILLCPEAGLSWKRMHGTYRRGKV